MGAPQGLELSLSEGIISQLRGGGPHPIIQTTVAISPGSSGGGLFNARGELVGITTFYLKDGQSLNFALPVEWIDKIAGGKVQQPQPENSQFGWLGPPVPIEQKGPPPTWSDRAIALEKAQDWPRMLDWCRQWTKAEPGNDLAWFSLGVAYGKLSRYREAIEAYREALRLKPDEAGIWKNLAIAYFRSGNRSAALEAVKELRRYDPKMANELLSPIIRP